MIDLIPFFYFVIHNKLFLRQQCVSHHCCVCYLCVYAFKVRRHFDRLITIIFLGIVVDILKVKVFNRSMELCSIVLIVSMCSWLPSRFCVFLCLDFFIKAQVHPRYPFGIYFYNNFLLRFFCSYYHCLPPFLLI